MGEAAEDEWAQLACAVSPSVTPYGEDDGLPPVETLDFGNLPPLPPEQIHGLLRQGGKLYITAPSKAGKTFLSIELAESVAVGGEWLGWECEQGRVLYCNFEIDRASFYDRLNKVAERKGFDKGTLEKNLHVWNMRGHTRKADELLEPLGKRIDGRDYSLVVLDPIYKLLGGNESDSEVIERFAEFLDKVTNLGCSVAYVHHHSKGAQAGKSAMDRGSGSGVFARDADAMVDLLEIDVPDSAMLHADPDATAWRASGVARLFKGFRPFEVWFTHPVHVLDEMGELADANPLTPGKKDGSGSSESSWRAKGRRLDEAADKWRAEHPGEELTRNCLMGLLHIGGRDTFDRWMEHSEKYRKLGASDGGAVTVVPKGQR